MERKIISVLGDSISHGANAPDIPNQSYLGIIKHRIAEKTQVYNYGFTSLQYMMLNDNGRYWEIHSLKSSGFTAFKDGRCINAYNLMAYEKGSYVDISVKERFNEAYIYYQSDKNFGSFEVYAGDRLITTINSDDNKYSMKIAGPIDISMFEKADIKIKVVSENKPILLSGMAYYNDRSATELNNYGLSGLCLCELSDNVIDTICNADIVIFSIGHNDSYFSLEDSFTKKINTAIKSIKNYGAKVLVNDFCWFSNPKKNHYKLELKRLANETGGIYTDYAAELPNFLENGLSDWAHPTPKGHKMIADLLMSHLKDILK